MINWKIINSVHPLLTNEDPACPSQIWPALASGTAIYHTSSVVNTRIAPANRCSKIALDPSIVHSSWQQSLNSMIDGLRAVQVLLILTEYELAIRLRRSQGSDMMDSQRRNYWEGRMPQLRKEYLESIGFVWTTKRFNNEWHPDQYSKPDPKAIAKMIVDEKSRLEEFPSSAPEGLKVRVKADRALVEALQEYLDKLESK